MKNKQTLLRIGLPEGKRLYPSQFRELLAKEPHLPNALFHRDTEGRTVNERPGVRMAGGRGWVGIVADAANERLLRDAVGPAIVAVSRFVGQACPVGVEEHEFGIQRSNEPKPYWLREMAIKRVHPRARAIPVAELIEQRVLGSLEATCEKYGLDCPTADELSIKTLDIAHERGLRIQTTAGLTNNYCHLVDALVMIHADLDGLWFVGNFTSRGYGRVIKDRPGLRLGPVPRREVLN